MSVANIFREIGRLHIANRLFIAKCPSKVDGAFKYERRVADDMLSDESTSEAASISFTQLDSKPFEEEAE